MEQIKLNEYFIVTKTVGGRVTFLIKNDETQASLKVVLTPEQPSKRLPGSWAVNVFSTEDAYRMYKLGYFTFDRNEDLMRLAYESGHYFDTVLDFTPVKPDQLSIILEILKSGNKEAVKPFLISDKNKRDIVSLAVDHIKELKMDMVRFLEDALKIQLTTDGE